MNGKILKGGAPAVAPPAGKILDREVLAAHDGAREILAAAERDAAAIVERARAEAEAVRAAARDEGRAAGLAEWQERLAALAGAEARMLEEARPQLVQLALRVAEKILRQRLESRPETIVPMVEEALQAARGHVGGPILVRAHPDDAATLSGLQARLRAQGPRWESLDVLADPEMGRGGLRIETAFGTIDASVETQLRAIEQILLQGGAP